MIGQPTNALTLLAERPNLGKVVITTGGIQTTRPIFAAVQSWHKADARLISAESGGHSHLFTFMKLVWGR